MNVDSCSLRQGCKTCALEAEVLTTDRAVVVLFLIPEISIGSLDE